MSRLTKVCSLASVALLVAAGSAAAHARIPTKIVLFKSIGGFDLGVTPKQVERRLGRPGQTIRVAHRIASLTYYDYGLSFDFDTLQRSDPADDVGALGPPGAPAGVRYRTSKGIHVGDSATRVKRAYRGIKCSRYQCELYQGAPGAIGSRSTTFSLFAGKVTSIQLQTSYE